MAGEFERGERTLDPALEDIHMNVESRLTALIGEPGRRLHTARSRNDQVATDLRLYARARRRPSWSTRIDRSRGVALCRAGARARRHAAAGLHAPAARAAVTLATTCWPTPRCWRRDRGRLLDAARRAGESPLGSGALAGTSLPIDRAADGARRWASRGPRTTAWMPSRDRDFAAEIAFACALLGVHLSRLGEELVLWSTTEFGFVRSARATARAAR